MKILLKTSIYLGTLILLGIGIFLYGILNIYNTDEFPAPFNYLDLWPILLMFIIASIFYFNAKRLIKK